MKTGAIKTDFDVIHIGYGPVSKTLAVMLDRLDWKVGIFEKFAEVYPLPRAVCIDHEIFRMLKASGMGDIADKVTSPAPVYRWFNADWKELLSIDWTAGSISGGPEVNFVHQPSFERELDKDINSRKNISLNYNSEAVAVKQNDDYVTVTIKNVETGEENDYTARYLVGMDGANSFVRESLGITRTDKGFEADWLVVDFILNDGLSAKDLGLIECGQHCNPKRPTTIVPGGFENGKECRRWEFMRLPHETKEEMITEAKVQELLGDWIKPDQGTLVRHALYTFRSLVANQWREKRILLAGDAAHLMPPFMGQGMCAGLRDVWNLVWKLNLILKGAASDNLLDSYEPERSPHISDVIDASVYLGEVICVSDEKQAAERDEAFLSGTATPPPPFPILTDGFLQRNQAGEIVGLAGELSPHAVVRHDGKTGRFDDFVPNGFTLVLTESCQLNDLSADTKAKLSSLNINIAVVVNKLTATDAQFADTQNNILPFMTENDICAMLIRPDFYLFGAAQTSDAVDQLVENLATQAAKYDIEILNQ